MALTRDAIDGIVTNAVLLAVACLAVALRFTARIKGRASLKWDDWTILFALIYSAGIYTSAIWAASSSVRGVPFQSFTYTTWIQYRKVLFTDIIICHFIYGVIKISFNLFYRRIFKLERMFTILSTILLVANTIFIISAFFAVLFSSRNISTFWTTPPLLDGTEFLVDFPAMLIAMAVIKIILNLAILILPIPIIAKVQLPPVKKVSIIAIFLSGGFYIVSSIVRLYYGYTLLTYYGGDGSRTLELADNNDLWAHIEAFASIITACLPTLGPLLYTHRGLESLIGSIRSLFFIRSRSISKADLPGAYSPNKPSGTSLKGERRAWYELSTRGSEPVTALGGTMSDVNAISQRSDTIMVRQTLSDEDNKWV